MTKGRALRFGATGFAALLALPMFVPQALAFPYHARSHGSEIWSETPLPQAAIDAVIARAAALTAASPLARPAEPRRVFLTNGGWRWTWLASTSRGGFGLTRPVIEAVVVNRSDVTTDRVWNRAAVGGERTLSSVIAHETCHGMERRRFGIWVDLIRPNWLVEGYCDHVAQESSLSDADVAALKAAGRSHPALLYREGRRRVAAALVANGGDVDALFSAD